MSSSEADAAEGSPATPGKAIDAQEHEPRLKYEALDSGSPRAQTLHSAITRLCVSDKVLAVGRRDGSVQLLDHLGNQASGGGEPLRRTASLPSTPPCRHRHSRSPRVGARQGHFPSLSCAPLQVREFREHSREVTDLSFDGGAEFLASGSADGTVAVRLPSWHASSALPACLPMLLVEQQGGDWPERRSL